MPTYTVLGSTGSTGSAIIRTLIASPPPNLKLRVFVRSKSKLLNLIPDLSTRSDTEMIEGFLTSQSQSAKCLASSDAIFSCIATNDSAPGTTIAIDTTASIISALKEVRKSEGGNYTPPVILVLASASYLFEDLRKAESLYKSLQKDDPGLLEAMFVQPPSIMPGTVATGHRLSTEEREEVVSFADVAGGMIEMAENRETLKWKGVSVLATGEVVVDWGANRRFCCLG